MRLLLHDTLVTAPYVFPIRDGWLTPDLAGRDSCPA